MNHKHAIKSGHIISLTSTKKKDFRMESMNDDEIFPLDTSER